MVPKIRMARQTSAVMTGRSMKMRERFMTAPRSSLAGVDRLDLRAGEEAQLAVGDDGVSGRDALCR